MGLPGSGKTRLARELSKKINCKWINADKVREKYKDWDFSKKGVLRQSRRMHNLAKKTKKKFVVADFVCPYEKGRKIFKPDYLIWMNTIKKGRLSTFDKTFQKPRKYNFKIMKKNAKACALQISKEILRKES